MRNSIPRIRLEDFGGRARGLVIFVTCDKERGKLQLGAGIKGIQHYRLPKLFVSGGHGPQP